MTISQNLGIPVSDADFLCAHWRPEHCDPRNWEYIPSTYGVEGVTLVGNPQMRLWSDTPDTFKNPGRYKFSASNVLELQKVIENEGVNPKIGSIVYYDVDDDSSCNGEHRRNLSYTLQIPGWMMQGVKFDSPEAKIRFAVKSNNRDEITHTNSSKDDVKSAAIEILKRVEGLTDSQIIDEVKDLGHHLRYHVQRDIWQSIQTQLRYNNKIVGGERYRSYNKDLIEPYLETLKGKDPWIEDFLNNDDEFTIYIQVNHFESRIGAIMSLASLAVKEGKPIHFIFSVPIPQSKETLATKRFKFFENHVASLEQRLMDLSGLGELHRKNFPWNHPEAQHRCPAQDTENEKDELENSLIYVKNRHFN